MGRFFVRAMAGALNRAVGIWLPGNGVRVTGSRIVLATPLDWQAADASAPKSPLRVACVGTKASDCGGAVRSLVPWKPAKKNNRSFLTGPPTVPPNWFRLK